MKITDEKLGELTFKLTVQVEPEDYSDSVNSVLKDYAKQVQLKGFRKGKVPLRVVKKMYGKGVLLEELNKIVSSELELYLTEKKIKVVGDPIPLTSEVDLEGDDDTSYYFEFEIGVAGEFDINYGLAGENPLYSVSIDDETLEKEIEHFQRTYGPMSNPDSSQPGDVLFGKLIQVDEGGDPVEGGYSRMFSLNPERVKNEGFKEKMGSGLKPEEDHLLLKMEEVTENDNEIRHVWEYNVHNEKIRTISNEDLEAIKEMNFIFQIRKINRIEPMAVGQELFDLAFGEGTITSEEEMRARLSENMKGFFEREAQRFYRSKTMDAFLEGNTIELPDEFLQQWLIRTHDEITEGNINEKYESYKKSITWTLIVEKMQQENPDMVVTESDLQSQAEAAVIQQFGDILKDVDDERKQQFVRHFLEDEKMAKRLFKMVLERKIFEGLEAKSPPTTEDITAADFLEILKR